MSILTSAAAAAALQIWDNAAFDPSLSPLINLDPSKENQNPHRPSSSASLDAEIAAIESEIARLFKNLHSLRLKKSQIDKQSQLKEGGGRSKFLNLETPPRPAAKAGTAPRPHRRGLSLGGPTDLLLLRNNATTPKPAASKNVKDPTFRRGMSVGPSEILKQTAMMNSRVLELRKGIATVGPKVNSGRKGGDGPVKAKALFSEEIKKRPKGRVVASRYSLPHNNNGNASKGGDEGNMKRRKWSPQSPSPPTIGKIGEVLPKIRIVRAVGMESPRDSGRAKKVAELVGKRSPFFFDDEGSVSSCSSSSFSCQRLSFED